MRTTRERDVGSGTWQQSPYRNKKQLVDECVEVHLALADSCLQQARGRATGFDGINAETASMRARHAWGAMQRARLFCFDPTRWISMYNAADRYTTTELAGLDWIPGARNRIHTEADQIVIDNHLMWGIDANEAVRRGYLKPTGRTNNEAVITREGLEAFKERIRELPEHKQVGIRKMLEVAIEADESNHHDKARIVSIACAEVEDALRESTPEEAEKIFSAYEDYGVRWPFPDPLPFDACFFCFGRKLNLVYSPTALHTRIRPGELGPLGVSSVYLLGYLVAWEGDTPFIFTALQFGDGDGLAGFDPETGLVKKGGAVGLIVSYEDGEWTQPMSLDPWVLTMLVKAINDHKQIIDTHPTNLAARMARKKASKRAGQLLPMPAPFYMVDLKDELIQAPLKKVRRPSGRAIEWSHRWDVRGHECVRIERGTQPIPAKEVAKLKKRGYHIYDGMSLPAEDAARLLKRSIRAPGPQEWIAVLSYWRDSFVKGPEGKPYVPAARVEPRSA